MLSSSDKYQEFLQVLESQAKPNSALYHYTTWSGLRGILQTQQLWLTDYRSLTDTSELKHAINLIKKHVLSCSEKGNMELFWNDLFCDVEDIRSNMLDCFIFSFCERKNYLYVWRGYADDGKGFSIGFKKEFFEDSQSLPIDRALIFGRSKVFYNYDELSKTIYNLAKMIEQDIKQGNALSNSQTAKELRRKIVYSFFANLLPYVVSIKHEAYAEEHEYRIYTIVGKEDCPQRIFTPGGNVESPHLGSKLRVYFSFNLQYISEIWVGPQLNFEHAKSDIEQILSSLRLAGHDVDEIQIYKSEIPYKSLF